jgi:hypothetical protein
LASYEAASTTPPPTAIGLPAQVRLQQLFDRCVERVEVGVKDRRACRHHPSLGEHVFACHTGAVTEPVRIHLVDGTFELFRCFHGAPRATNEAGLEVGAARGLLATITALVHRPEVTHVAVAFDSVVAPPPSARGGKPTGMLSGDQLISAQAGLAAESVRSLGIRVWPSGRYQADEMIATGAARYAADPTVCQVVICSTDNDFNQCVRGSRIVVLDRIRNVVTDEDAVVERYGVAPSQLPDLFALVGGPQRRSARSSRMGPEICCGDAPAVWIPGSDAGRRTSVGRRRARRARPGRGTA